MIREIEMERIVLRTLAGTEDLIVKLVCMEHDGHAVELGEREYDNPVEYGQDAVCYDCETVFTHHIVQIEFVDGEVF